MITCEGLGSYAYHLRVLEVLEGPFLLIYPLIFILQEWKKVFNF